MDLFKKTLKPVERVLADAELKKSEVDEIVLVGGSTRIPKVQQLLRDFFNGKDPSKGINPDEAVAYGAAVQGGILSGQSDLNGIVLLDVAPLTLGIETVGGVMTKLIPRNTVVPTKKTQVFSTNADNQPAVNIQIYQGERAMTKDNQQLGKFDLRGIPPAPRGVPQIEVTFEIDANGILSVEAKDKAMDKGEKITITNDKSRLSEAEIQQRVEEAERFAERDREEKERVEARNSMEAFVHSTKTTLSGAEQGSTFSDQLSDDEREQIDEALEEANEYLDDHQDASKEELDEKMSELQAAVNPIMKLAYERAGVKNPGGDGAADDDGLGDDEFDSL